MQKGYFPGFRYLLVLVLALSIVANFHYCLAEDSKNDDEQMVPADSDEILKFKEGDYWKILAGQLQFTPDQKSQDRFFRNVYPGPLLFNYTVSVNTEWLGEADYGDYGLFFGGDISGYYVFTITQGGYIALFQNSEKGWKKIKVSRKRKLAENATNTLKVVCKKSNIQCWLNGKLLFDVVGKSLPPVSSVGVCCSGNVQCGFKDFTVESLL